jgi:hypothetical protein
MVGWCPRRLRGDKGVGRRVLAVGLLVSRVISSAWGRLGGGDGAPEVGKLCLGRVPDLDGVGIVAD